MSSSLSGSQSFEDAEEDLEGSWGLLKGTGEFSSGLSVTDGNRKMQWGTEEQPLCDSAEPCECRIKWKLEFLEKHHRNAGGAF